MGMEPVSPALLQRKLIMISPAGRNWILADKRDTVHQRGKDQAVPMDAGRFLQLINHFDIESVRFLYLQTHRAVLLFDRDDFPCFPKNRAGASPHDKPKR